MAGDDRNNVPFLKCMTINNALITESINLGDLETYIGGWT
jgi:hypothetical protein